MSAQPADKPKKGTPAQLARHMAAGGAITQWCRDHGVAERTGYRWSSRAKFKNYVGELRRRATDQAASLLSAHAITAAVSIITLASDSENDTVRLTAARTLLSELRELTDFNDLKAKVAAIEARLDKEVKRREKRRTS